jgi:thioredoxin-related protein
MLIAMGLIFLNVLAIASPSLEGKDVVSEKTVQINPGKRGLVAVFLSAKCPCSNSHIPVLQKLSKEFPEYRFVGIHSNSDETTDETKAYFQKAALDFPVLDDTQAKWADTWQALKTPHVFLFDREGKIIYKGGLTNSSNAEKAKQNFLRDALVAHQAGKNIDTSEGRTLGCIISRRNK